MLPRSTRSIQKSGIDSDTETADPQKLVKSRGGGSGLWKGHRAKGTYSTLGVLPEGK